MEKNWGDTPSATLKALLPRLLNPTPLLGKTSESLPVLYMYHHDFIIIGNELKIFRQMLGIYRPY